MPSTLAACPLSAAEASDLAWAREAHAIALDGFLSRPGLPACVTVGDVGAEGLEACLFLARYGRATALLDAAILARTEGLGRMARVAGRHASALADADGLPATFADLAFGPLHDMPFREAPDAVAEAARAAFAGVRRVALRARDAGDAFMALAASVA